MDNQLQNSKEEESRENKRLLNVWGLAGELGLLIAIPVVVLVLAGVWLDKKLGTLPLFIIVGIVVSMIVSTVAVARKVKRVI